MQSSASITLPTDMNEIPLYQMSEYLQLNDLIEPEERALRALSIFGDIPYRDILKMPLNTLKRASAILEKTLSQTPQFENRFTLNGVEYGFIPDLDELSTGEFIDIDTYQKNRGDLYRVMGVLYRPVRKKGMFGKYEIEPYNGKVNEVLKGMPAGIAIGAQVFFYSLGTDLLHYTLKHLEEMKTTPQELTSKLSHKNMDGLGQSIAYLTEIYYQWTALRLCPFIRPYIGCVTKSTLQRLKETESNDKIENDNDK